MCGPWTCTLLLVAAALLVYTDAQVMEAQLQDICNYESGMDEQAYYIGVSQDSTWPTEGHCVCQLATRNDTWVQLEVTFKVPADSEYQSNYDGCSPVMYVDLQGHGFFACPARNDQQRNNHTAQVKLTAANAIKFHIFNPKRVFLENKVRIYTDSSLLQVSCQASSEASFEKCPCPEEEDDVNAGPVYDTPLSERLGIGFGCAIAFLVLVAIIAVGYYCLKKRKSSASSSKPAEKTQSPNDQQVNKAYDGSQQDMRNRPPQKNAQISYTPDPNLNLEMQKGAAPHHGSFDSGLANGSQDRPPQYTNVDLQPYATSQSLENLNQAQPQNYNPLIGHGSLSSLDPPQGMGPAQPEVTYAKVSRGQPYSHQQQQPPRSLQQQATDDGRMGSQSNIQTEI